VGEDEPIYLDDRRQLAQPAAVLAVAAECLAQFDVAERCPARGLVAIARRRRVECLEIFFTYRRRIGAGERRVLAGGCESHVAEHSRGFVIAEQHVRVTAGHRRLALELS
jgi:hypothetical protein